MKGRDMGRSTKSCLGTSRGPTQARVVVKDEVRKVDVIRLDTVRVLSKVY